MTVASDILPLLPPKDLFPILFKIFHHLNEDKDIHTYRLINKSWRDFIDYEILNIPLYRSKFLQHPLGLPAERRTPLLKANLSKDFREGKCPTFAHTHGVYDKGQFVLITTRATNALPFCYCKVALRIFQKTNMALREVGSVEVIQSTKHPLSEHVFAVSEDYFFYLTLRCPKSYHAVPLTLQGFKKEGDTWNSFQHPASYLWQKEEAQILGLRQMSSNRAFLVVAQKEKNLLKVYNLWDGSLVLSGKCIFPQNWRLSKEDSLSRTFDMDAFGLVIWTNSEYLQHFSFKSQINTWRTKVKHDHGEIVKSKKWTLLFCQHEKDIIILDNATGAVTNSFNYRRLPCRFFPTVTSSGRYIIFQGETSLNTFGLQGESSPQVAESARGLVVFDIQESRLICAFKDLPGIVFDHDNHACIHSVTELSDTTVTCAITFYSYTSRHTRKQIIMLSSSNPEKMTVLAYNQDQQNTFENEKLLAIVPCDHGFFAVSHKRSGGTPPYDFQLLSWKY